MSTSSQKRSPAAVEFLPHCGRPRNAARGPEATFGRGFWGTSQCGQQTALVDAGYVALGRAICGVRRGGAWDRSSSPASCGDTRAPPQQFVAIRRRGSTTGREARAI
jgi:hypothetical protein